MIYELMVDIAHIEPRIWRKLSVPGDYSLADLHIILQIAFNWGNCHLHSFTVNSTEYGPEPEAFRDEYPLSDEADVFLDDLHLEEKQKFTYLYDFGDSWEHRITVSRILPNGPEQPCCLDGKRAGPLEDSGGSWAYSDMLEILKDPKHKEYEETHEWVGDFDSEFFNPTQTNIRLGKAFRTAGTPVKAPVKAAKTTTGASKTVKTAEAKAAPPRSAKPAKSPTTAQHKKLYQLMEKIKELAPWEKLRDQDKILLWLPGRKEPLLCIALGQSGECYGLCVYPGFEAIASFLRILQGDDENLYFLLGCQNYIMCHLGGRDELLPEERARLKELGISFRGRHDWVYFRRLSPGLFPWQINSNDARLLIETLTQYLSAYSRLAGGEVSVDFGKGKALIHRYEGGTWKTQAGDMPPTFLNSSIPNFKDSVLDSLLLKKKTTAVLEADLLYLPIPVGENEEGIPILARMSLLLDTKKGIVVGQDFPEPEKKRENLMLGMLLDYIEKSGRPKTLKVRDLWEEAIFRDLCHRLDIELIHSRGMPRIDELSKSLPQVLEKYR
jgi:hypothetical protein